MEFSYIPKGVCSKQINLKVENNKIESVSFVGGCEGNLKAIGKLVKGMDVDKVISLLEGNTCGKRDTSCADQMCIALKEAITM